MHRSRKIHSWTSTQPNHGSIHPRDVSWVGYYRPIYIIGLHSAAPLRLIVRKRMFDHMLINTPIDTLRWSLLHLHCTNSALIYYTRAYIRPIRGNFKRCACHVRCHVQIATSALLLVAISTSSGNQNQILHASLRLLPNSVTVYIPLSLRDRTHGTELVLARVYVTACYC